MRLLFLDTETTGLDPGVDRWIEVAAIEAVVGEVDVDVGCFSTLIGGPCSLAAAVRQLTGLNEQALQQAPAEEQVVELVAQALARVDAVVCWNAAFDRSFVQGAFERCGVSFSALPWWCALELCRRQRPELPSYRLGDVAAAFGVDAGRSHRALDDARATAAVWRALQPRPSSSPAAAAVEAPPTGVLALFR